jgi:hypothetical protein
MVTIYYKDGAVTHFGAGILADSREEADNKLRHSVEMDSWLYERPIREWKSVLIDKEKD